MEKVINLDFGSPSKKALAGVKYGEQIFKNQVATVMNDSDWKEPFTITFPEAVIMIGFSFWLGFSRPLVGKIGPDGVRERVQLITSSKKLTEELYRDLV